MPQTNDAAAVEIQTNKKQNLVAFTLVVSLFFLWAFLHNMNPILIPHLKKACQLSDTQSSFIDSAVYLGYFLAAIPAGLFIHRWGYKKGIIFGLILFAFGALLFIPAAEVRQYWFFLVALFISACGATFLETIDLTPVKPTIKRTVITRDSVVARPVTQAPKITIDSATGKPVVMKNFEFNAKDPQYVALVLDKVDPVFINEAKNALNRYNQINFYNQKLTMTPVKLDDRYNLVLVGPFTDAGTAIAYADKTKSLTTSRILPWLAPEKYNYTIISQSNLDILKESRDIDGYRQLLEKVLPGKF